MKAALLAAAVVALCAAPAAAQTSITGRAVVIDGDTLFVAGAGKIRLQGIDAPETDQVCGAADGRTWSCGLVARDRLASKIAGNHVDCDLNDTDRYGRALGLCFVDGEDIQAWMARQGLAVAFRRYSLAYVEQEAAARRDGRGVWQGPFTMPWDWRKEHPKGW